MDHDVYENHMIETINQHGEKTAKEKFAENCSQVMNEIDTKVVVTGLKRTLLAFATLATLAASVFGFITVAKAQGYMAVVFFFASIIALLVSYTLLYAQGIVPKVTQKSGGETNE